MKHRLLTFCSTLSLLLCLAVGIVWVRSQSFRTSWPNGPGQPRNYVRLYHQPGVSACFASIAQGNLWIVQQRAVGSEAARRVAAADVGDIGRITLTARTGTYGTGVNWWGGPGEFDWMRHAPAPPPAMQQAGWQAMEFWAVRLPLWVFFWGFLALPGVRLVLAARTRRKAAPGHCRRCGYDLRASPERCPECGTPTEVKA